MVIGEENRMSNLLNVLHINSYYAYHDKPGFYKNFFEEQVNRGMNIDVYIPLDHTIEAEIEPFGYYTTIIKSHNKIDRYFYYSKQMKMLKGAINRYEVNRFEIIHSHSLFSNGFVAYRLNQMYNIPYVVAVRDTDVNTFFKKLFYLRNLGIRILMSASRIIFLSETYKNQVLKEYIPLHYHSELLKKIEVIPNGIDPFWFENQLQEKKHLHNNELRLLFVGSVSKRKNPSTVVRACEILQKRGYTASVTIIGPIESNAIYKDLIKYDFVEYISTKPKYELVEYYRRSDIFIMTSITETFGLVYVEAMSQGLPVIYSMGQGFDGQFDEGVVGYHVDCFNPDEVADRVMDIVSGYEEFSQRCIDNCQQFNWITINERYTEIYNEIHNCYK
jgi:glycosyltransferase involved in cell wall biosynthesis